MKDKLTRIDRADDLIELIEQATKINNRLYERTLERKGYYFHGKSKHRSKKQSWPQPIELDVISKGRTKPNISKDKINHRHDNKLCFKCGLPGHQAASHRKAKKP